MKSYIARQIQVVHCHLSRNGIRKMTKPMNILLSLGTRVSSVNAKFVIGMTSHCLKMRTLIASTSTHKQQKRIKDDAETNKYDTIKRLHDHFRRLNWARGLETCF